MSRTPPERTPDQQRDHDWEAAMRTGTPDAVRRWATQYDVPLIHPEDDELLLDSIHTARAQAFTGAARRESVRWLAANHARVMAERGGTP
jgi:hypothetical protein